MCSVEYALIEGVVVLLGFGFREPNSKLSQLPGSKAP